MHKAFSKSSRLNFTQLLIDFLMKMLEMLGKLLLFEGKIIFHEKFNHFNMPDIGEVLSVLDSLR